MIKKTFNCVLFADRHHGLTEGVCGLLGTIFENVVMVADEASMLESAGRLQPELAVVDGSLTHGNGLRWIQGLRQSCPAMKLIVLSVHDESSVRQATMESGADGFVLKRDIATDLLPAVESLLAVPGDGRQDEKG